MTADAAPASLDAIVSVAEPTLKEGARVRCKRTGQIGTVVNIFEGGSLIMIKSDDSGLVSYVVGNQIELIRENEVEGLSFGALARATERRVQPAIEIDPNTPRFNLNTVTEDQLFKVLKGITKENAKKIVTYRTSQSGEKFKDWDAVERVLDREFDVAAIKATNLFYLQ